MNNTVDLNDGTHSRFDENHYRYCEPCYEAFLDFISEEDEEDEED